ncbi:MAG: hypothetical protein DBY32_04005 [Phascolarctobacterium sp.]|nr:MAG: hypothetical protein DBY32_04005 [Phascolarctobacterium sp.]
MELKCHKNLKYAIGDRVEVDKTKVRGEKHLTKEEWRRAANGTLVKDKANVVGARPIVSIEYLVEFNDGTRTWLKEEEIL